MDTKLIETLLSTIADVIRADGDWKGKRDAILNECSIDDRTNLGELVAWFEEAEEEEGE